MTLVEPIGESSVMPSALGVDPDTLDFHDAPQLIWITVQDAAKLMWRDNPKLHDIGAIAESIRKYGYQMTAKFDLNLFRVGQSPDDLDPLGAIKAGNGRIETLAWMERMGHDELPRGLAQIKESSQWAVWLLIGTDAESRALAEAYAIDDNNLTLAGSDMMPWEVAQIYEQEGYLEVLGRLAETETAPISLGVDGLEALLFPPDFVPASGDEQPRLDKKRPVTCPECGHVFTVRAM